MRTKMSNLRKNGGVSFEDIEAAIGAGRLLADIDNPSNKFRHQKILVVKMNMYAYVVPYVSKIGEVRFLKTAYPSRKYTKQFLQGE